MSAAHGIAHHAERPAVPCAGLLHQGPQGTATESARTRQFAASAAAPMTKPHARARAERTKRNPRNRPEPV
eukprot:14815826-Alexandrium_andersonii.AAC.1